MQHHHYLLLLISCSIAFMMITQSPSQTVQAQPRITNTTIPVVIPTTAPTQPPQAPNNNAPVEASPSPTFTPTEPLPDARLISVAADGSALILDFPQDGVVVGTLQEGTEYQVLGQYFSWYQVQLPTAQLGAAWVYFEDVRVSGNLNEIPFVDPESQPAQLSAQDIETATAQVLFQTPGFASTATAESRVLELPQETANAQPNEDSASLPTYTPPADIVQLQPTTIPDAPLEVIPEDDFVTSTIDAIAAGDIPPILPVIGLAIIGFFGLIIASIRD